MTTGQKINISSVILAVIILLLIFFVINLIFGQIRRESDNLIIQRKELIELEGKIKNLQDFKANLKQYQPNLEKMDKLFADASEPIEFIEFLENEAATSHISIDIVPLAQKKQEGNFGPTLGFNLNLVGPSPNFLRFLERLEFAPHLIQPLNLNIRKVSDKKDEISAALSIKVYVK